MHQVEFKYSDGDNKVYGDGGGEEQVRFVCVLVGAERIGSCDGFMMGLPLSLGRSIVRT